MTTPPSSPPLVTKLSSSKSLSPTKTDLIQSHHHSAPSPSVHSSSKYKFSIDRGGTFTDVHCILPVNHMSGQREVVLKLLSEDPLNYSDAPTEGIRRILAKYDDTEPCTESSKAHAFSSSSDDESDSYAPTLIGGVLCSKDGSLGYLSSLEPLQSNLFSHDDDVSIDDKDQRNNKNDAHAPVAWPPRSDQPRKDDDDDDTHDSRPFPPPHSASAPHFSSSSSSFDSSSDLDSLIRPPIYSHSKSVSATSSASTFQSASIQSALLAPDDPDDDIDLDADSRAEKAAAQALARSNAARQLKLSELSNNHTTEKGGRQQMNTRDNFQGMTGKYARGRAVDASAIDSIRMGKWEVVFMMSKRLFSLIFSSSFNLFFLFFSVLLCQQARPSRPTPFSNVAGKGQRC